VPGLPAGGPGKGTSVWGGGVQHMKVLRKDKEEKNRLTGAGALIYGRFWLIAEDGIGPGIPRRNNRWHLRLGCTSAHRCRSA